MTTSEQRVAVVIPAKGEQDRIAATIRAVRAIPHVDLVIVINDGSKDDTQKTARDVGTTVVRHSINRGGVSATETEAQVVTVHSTEGHPPRLLFFLDADLGDTAVEVSPLVIPVLEGKADFAVAALPPQEGAGGFGLITGTAFKAIRRTTGWEPRQPISGQRYMMCEAFMATLPLTSGWGVETGMTIDLLVTGFAVQGVVYDLKRRTSGNSFAGQLHQTDQHKGVAKAVLTRHLRRVHVPHGKGNSASKPYEPYNTYKG